MQASTSKAVYNAVTTTSSRSSLSSSCLTRAASTSSRSSTPKARSRKPAAPPRPNLLPFSDAIRTLRSLQPADSSSAFELTLLPKLAASVNINSLRGRTFLAYDASNQKKKEVILVFAEGEQADEARKEGADIVGGKELIDEVLQSRIQPTKIICSPDLLLSITRSQLPRVLGPKGLMPSAKRGSVTSEIGKAIREARGGLDWMGVSIGNPAKEGSNKDKADRGMVSVSIARMAFEEDRIRQNVRQFGREVLDVCNGVGTQAEVDTRNTAQRKKQAAIEKMYLTTSRGISVEVTDVQQVLDL